MNFDPSSDGTRRKLWIAAIILALFTVTGFFVVPPVLKTQLEKRLSAELGRAVTVQEVHFNPYALSVTLLGFDVRERDGKSSFIGWARLYVNFDALASLTGDWVLSEVELSGFHTAATIKADGSLSFADILAKLTAKPADPAAKPGRPIRVGSLRVVQARVDFSDLSRKTPFNTTVGPLTFVLTEFRTAGSRGAPYHFSAITEAGEKLTWSGTLAADPVESHGEFEIADLILKKYTPYVEGKIQSDLTDGTLSVRGRYEVNLGATPHAMKLFDTEVHLKNLKVTEWATHQSAVELAALDVTGVQADALAMKATVGRIALTGGHLVARREKDGGINLLTMMQPAAASASSAPAQPATPATPAKPPEVMIGEVALNDFQVNVTDLAAPRPAQLGLSAIQFSLKNVTLAEGAVMPLDLALAWAPQGTVHVTGTISIKPELKADLKTEVTALAILPLSPYLEQFVNAQITQGAVSTTSTAQVARVNGQPAVTLDGSVQVEKFGLVDGAHNEELAGFGSLTLSGLKVVTAPQMTVSLAEVNVTGPYARVLVNEDKSLNLAALAKTAEAPAPAGKAAFSVPSVSVPAATPAPKIEVGKVIISGGEYTLSDRSVEPHVRMAVNQFAGTITGLSSENMAKAGVELKAMVDGAGPVAITGQLDPLGPRKFVDLKIDFRNVDLLPLSPYSGKFAGYELARGKLALDVKFRLDDKKIDATNLVTLNQFTFGNAVKSPDATGLPVRLGVALLKDSEGKIVIDVPIEGSVDDPAFHIGKVVWRVINNLLVKVATSPFALLGSMFGGGGDELGYQEFGPGLTELQPEEIKKLETMVKALTNRPGLSLDIAGSYDGPADGYVLKRQKVANEVRHAVWEAKHALDPNIAPPEQLVITPEENAAKLRQLYDLKFPAGTEMVTPLAKAPEAAAPPPGPKKGFLGRVVDVVTLKKLRSGKAKSAAPKPANEVAIPGAPVNGPTVEEMTGRLAETVEVSENDLRALGADRAQRVRDYFIQVGKIDPERLFLAKDESDPAKAGKGPRVFLTLQ